MITLDEVLELVGTLDDSADENSAANRFRTYLQSHVTKLGVVRDYIETCLRGTGRDQALQDLVNHTARLVGFDVEFGRYRGTRAEIGFDGIWRHGKLAVVVEVKTTDAFPIDVTTVLGYIDKLVAEKGLSRKDTLGLYVVGRRHERLKQLEAQISYQQVGDRLRVASVESILSIAELVQEEHLSQDEAIGLLMPPPANVDSFITLLRRVAPPAGEGEAAAPTRATVTAAQSSAQAGAQLPPEPHMHLLTPVADEEDVSAEETIRSLLKAGWYVFGDHTPGRKRLKPGDRLCFYQSGTGVVAEAEVDTTPERKRIKQVRDHEKFPWAFRVKNVRFFFDHPVVLDAELRSRLEAFEGRDPSRPWAWMVQGTRRVSEHDFELLCGKQSE